MNRFAIFAASALFLAGCSSAQIDATKTKLSAIEIQVQADVNTFCEVDQQLVPFVQAGASVASIILPQVAGVVALDQSTVHPMVLAACKALGGVVVAPPKPSPA